MLEAKKFETGSLKLEARTLRKNVIKTYRDLEIYKLSYQLAIEIFSITKKFPKDEMYSLSSQIRNSSRSVPSNIAEGWSKRRYENIFKRHLTDAIGSVDETIVWLDFSLDFQYIDKPTHERLVSKYNEVGKMIYKLTETWKTY